LFQRLTEVRAGQVGTLGPCIKIRRSDDVGAALLRTHDWNLSDNRDDTRAENLRGWTIWVISFVRASDCAAVAGSPAVAFSRPGEGPVVAI